MAACHVNETLYTINKCSSALFVQLVIDWYCYLLS